MLKANVTHFVLTIRFAYRLSWHLTRVEILSACISSSDTHHSFSTILIAFRVCIIMLLSLPSPHLHCLMTLLSLQYTSLLSVSFHRVRFIMGEAPIRSTMASRYPEIATRRDKINDDFLIPSLTAKILPCGFDNDVFRFVSGDASSLKVARHPLNNRHYKSLVSLYSDRLRSDGYRNEDAGAIALVAVDSNRSRWWAIGGATRCEAVVDAAEKEWHGYIYIYIP